MFIYLSPVRLVLSRYFVTSIPVIQCPHVFLHVLFWNFCRQNALLATISEKDANIALLELSPTAGSDAEVRKFKAEKDKLVNELKEQVIWTNINTSGGLRRDL